MAKSNSDFKPRDKSKFASKKSESSDKGPEPKSMSPESTHPRKGANKSSSAKNK